MRKYSCRCGESISFGSMSPPRCYGCNTCGTCLVPEEAKAIYGPLSNEEFEGFVKRCREVHERVSPSRPFEIPDNGFPKPEEHKMETVMVQTDEGEKPYTLCAWCMKGRQKQWP